LGRWPTGTECRPIRCSTTSPGADPSTT
jgi:hypothetical protein